MSALVLATAVSGETESSRRPSSRTWKAVGSLSELMRPFPNALRKSFAPKKARCTTLSTLRLIKEVLAPTSSQHVALERYTELDGWVVGRGPDHTRALPEAARRCDQRKARLGGKAVRS